MTIGALSTFAGIDLPENVSNIVSTLISIIPPAILGWLIGSNKKSLRVAGIVLLLIYLCIILGIGSLLTLMAI